MNGDLIERAAALLDSADALLIGAGAGMGVDSGLPDFRGNQGFWEAYPPLKKLGISFVNMANPDWFHEDPTLAWGFYGHRFNLYNNTTPHRGFNILLDIGLAKAGGCFVFTSNVDGQFQKAGFDESHILEAHGSLQYLQCATACTHAIWKHDTPIHVDPETFRATGRLPRCPHCRGMARPNVLMFGDWDWLSDRSQEQANRYRDWLAQVRGGNLVAIELGAGTAIPTVRVECERQGNPLIRINLREPQTPRGGLSISGGALHTMESISILLK